MSQNTEEGKKYNEIEGINARIIILMVNHFGQ